MPQSLVVKGLVVTMDRERRIFRDGAVAVEGNRIVEVGKATAMLEKYSGSRCIGGERELVLPGFIDGHCHPMQYLAKGIADDVDLLTQLYKRIHPYESFLSPEEVHVAGLGHFTEMIKTGTTCFNEMGSYFIEEIVSAMRKIGCRGIVSRSTRDIFDPAYPIPEKFCETAEDAASKAEDIVSRFNGTEDGRLRAWFSLRSLRNVTDRLMALVRDLAERHRVGVHVHVAGFSGDDALLRKQFGLGAIERLKKNDLLSSNLFAAHIGWIKVEDIGALRAHAVKCCHCPSASMLGGYGNVSHGKFPEMIKEGVTVCLGTDGAACGRFLDMVRVMHLAACAHKDVRLDPEEVGAHKALEMATIDGARALRWEDEIGSLEPGKKADLILLDLLSPAWYPCRDEVANLVYSASGASVKTVIIDGRIVMQDGKILTVDEKDVVHQVQEASDRVLKRAGIDVLRKWPVF